MSYWTRDSADDATWRSEEWPAMYVGGRTMPAHDAALPFKSRSRRVSVDELDQAAAVYRQAVAEGRRDATEAVATALHVSRSTAARRLAKARERGLLGKPLGTKAGER